MEWARVVMQLSPPRRAEIAEALQKTLGELIFVALLEVISAEVMVFDTITEHEIGRGEHRAGDRKNRLLGVRRLLLRKNCARR